MGSMNLRGRIAVRLLAIVLVAAAGTVAAPYAQSRYPKTVVMLTTHSSPGGGSDVFLREMAPHLSQIMGVNVVVDNVAGGSGARAMAALAKAKPDGGMFYATTPTFVYTSLLSKPSASYRDLEPLVNIFYDPEVLYTAADSRFETRLSQFPDVRTVKQQGIDLSVRKFLGLAGPKGTPRSVIAAWDAVIPRLLADPELTEFRA